MGEPTWHQIPVAAGYLCECDHGEEEVPAVWQHGNGHFDHVPPDGVAYRCASHPPEPDPLAALRAQLAKVTEERDALRADVAHYRALWDETRALLESVVLERDEATDLLRKNLAVIDRTEDRQCAAAVLQMMREFVARAPKEPDHG